MDKDAITIGFQEKSYKFTSVHGCIYWNPMQKEHLAKVAFQ